MEEIIKFATVPNDQIVKLSKEVKVGLVTAIAIACFLYGFSFLKGKNLFSSQRKFYAVYSDIDGLVGGNPLMINGFIVGMVGDIELSEDASKKVIVTLVLNDDVDIPNNSIAKVISSNILGSKAIQLEVGNSVTFAESGDTLQSAQEENLKASVNKTIAPLQAKASELLSSIDSVMVVVQQVFNENARANLSKSFESIKLAITSLQTTAYRLDTLVYSEKAKISSILTKVNTLTKTLADNSDKLGNVINNFSNISDSLAKSNLTSAINNANTALSQASSILTKIDKGEGTMGMLINNDSLYRKLDKSSEDLDRLLKDLRVNPERYVHISVFGRKDRNKPKD
ncbi:MAG: transporter permease [Bacteroidota bacterium]|nr:transporter permease [Bacteroidota bacterium]